VRVLRQKDGKYDDLQFTEGFAQQQGVLG